MDEFRSIIGDLSKISPIVKFKLTNEDLLLYSIDTQEIQVVLVMALHLQLNHSYFLRTISWR